MNEGATANQEPGNRLGGIGPGLHIKSLVCTPQARGWLAGPVVWSILDSVHPTGAWVVGC